MPLHQPYRDSSSVTLWYAPEPEGGCTTEVPEDLTWHQIPMTGETLSANLMSAESQQFGASRAGRGATLTKGEVSGEINFEAQSSSFLRNVFVCALQAEAELKFGADALKRSVLRNGTKRHPLAILKKIDNGTGDGKADYYLFRGMQIDTLSLEIAPSALVTGKATLFGMEAASHLTASYAPSGWAFESTPQAPLISGQEALKEFTLAHGATPYDVALQTLTISLNNQLRQQHTVGNQRIFAEGLGTGRFEAKFSGTAYATSAYAYHSLLEDRRLKLVGRLGDSQLGNLGFTCEHVKALSDRTWTAEAEDQDLTKDLDLQAFDDGYGSTLTIVVGRGEPICDGYTYFADSSGRIFLTSDGLPVVYGRGCSDRGTAYFLCSDGSVFAVSDGKPYKVAVLYDSWGERYFVSETGELVMI